MQKLVPMLRKVSGTIGDIRIDKLTVIGNGTNGTNGANGDLASSLVRTNEQIKAAVGVDIPKLISGITGEGSSSRTIELDG